MRVGVEEEAGKRGPCPGKACLCLGGEWEAEAQDGGVQCMRIEDSGCVK